MKIAIIGTRGIPNQYGGFEAFAAQLAPEMVSRGHEVRVYCSSTHPLKDPAWKGVERVLQPDPAWMGSFSQFIYDLLCIVHLRKNPVDVILQLGYTSSGIWQVFLPKQTVGTNMDGLEWSRSKYPRLVQAFLKWSEKQAVRRADHLIADAKAIATYLETTYGRPATYLSYPAWPDTQAPEPGQLPAGLRENGYGLLVARAEPENHPEMIIQGWIRSKSSKKLVLVGNWSSTATGLDLLRRYSDHPKVVFLNPIYAVATLQNVRRCAWVNLHGHSVGGTNPSLLEAMAAGKPLLAHNNPFNQEVAGHEAGYFHDAEELATLIQETKTPEAPLFKEALKAYDPPQLWKAYEAFFLKMLQGNAEQSRQAK